MRNVEGKKWEQTVYGAELPRYTFRPSLGYASPGYQGEDNTANPRGPVAAFVHEFIEYSGFEFRDESTAA
jgi:hypothetical protein